MTITSKDLSKGGGLTGVARKEAEKAKMNEELLQKAIAHIESEKQKRWKKEIKEHKKKQKGGIFRRKKVKKKHKKQQRKKEGYIRSSKNKVKF